ncbi:MAG: methyltransferase domain-containing protein [Dermatophilaceae bacterium]|nr:methyltransferase domain-containing protein [Intrasporangiaceae bacterium]
MERLECDYWDAGRCRSCTLIETPYARQLAEKDAAARDRLPTVPDAVWATPQASAPAHFRNKAKLVVGGRPGAVTVGILDGRQQGVDLRDCPLHEEGLREAIRAVARVIDDLRLTPYDIPARHGELKYALLTRSPDGELMLRLVLRSRHHLERIRAGLDLIRTALPTARVISVNLHPEHKAVLEGDEEILLTEQATLPLRVNDVTLHLGVRSFFQTNTAVAAALYRTAREWTADLAVSTIADLYCGVGGFAHHLAGPGRQVTGVEISAEAIAAARLTRTTPPPRFVAGDATAYLRQHPAADLVIVNPPRRGITTLAGELERSATPRVLYSSCSSRSLATDLAAMPSFRPVHARLFDMFPQTHHSEVLVLLSRA